MLTPKPEIPDFVEVFLLLYFGCCLLILWYNFGFASQNTQFLLVQPFASFLIAQCHQNLHRPQQLMRCVSAPCWPACLKQRRTYIYSASVLFLFALHTYVAVQCKRNSNINNRNRKFLQRRLFFIFPQSLLCTAWLSPDKNTLSHTVQLVKASYDWNFQFYEFISFLQFVLDSK